MLLKGLLHLSPGVRDEIGLVQLTLEELGGLVEIADIGSDGGGCGLEMRMTD